MKRLVLCCVLLAAFQSYGQVSGPKVAFGLQADVANLKVGGSLEEVYGMGYGGGVHLDVEFMMFSLRASGDYITFSPDNDKYRSALSRLTGSAAAGFAIDGGRVNIMSGTLSGKWGVLPLPLLTPYLTGGIGLARLSVDEAKVTLNGVAQGSIPAVQAETKTLANVGAGADLKLPGLSLYLEAKYAWIFTEGETSSYIPITLGITF